MKKALLLLIPLSVCLIAWSNRFSSTQPASVRVVTSAAAPIGTFYAETGIGTANQSKVLTGLANKGYSHIMIANNTGASLALVNVSNVNPIVTPSTPLNQNGSSVQYLVLANNTVALDDVAIFDSIYLRSDGSSVTAVGNVDVMVW